MRLMPICKNQPAAPPDDEEARAQARMVLHSAALEDKDDLRQRIAEAKTEMRAKSPSAYTLFTMAAMHANWRQVRRGRKAKAKPSPSN